MLFNEIKQKSREAQRKIVEESDVMHANWVPCYPIQTSTVRVQPGYACIVLYADGDVKKNLAIFCFEGDAIEYRNGIIDWGMGIQKKIDDLHGDRGSMRVLPDVDDPAVLFLCDMDIDWTRLSEYIQIEKVPFM